MWNQLQTRLIKEELNPCVHLGRKAEGEKTHAHLNCHQVSIGINLKKNCLNIG